MKTIYVVIISILIAANGYSQSKVSTNKEPLNEKSLAELRQSFWDNLPQPILWTNDYEDLFTKEEEIKLNSIINTFEKKSSTEIVILTIDTLKVSKEKYIDLALHIAEKWQIGKKEKNNGILLVISKGYRKLRIQYGTGIEKVITEEETKNLTTDFFVPDYKKGNYYDGTLKGLTALIQLLQSKASLSN